MTTKSNVTDAWCEEISVEVYQFQILITKDQKALVRISFFIVEFRRNICSDLSKSLKKN